MIFIAINPFICIIHFCNFEIMNYNKTKRHIFIELLIFESDDCIITFK